MFQIRSQATSIRSSCANVRESSCAYGEHRGELAGVEVALVEQLLRGLDDRGHDPRSADDAARGAHGAVARLARDVADRERELRRPRERVAPLVHRGRAGMRGLAGPGDAPALDAEGPEDRAERRGPATRARDPARCGARGRRPRPRAGTCASSARSRSTPYAPIASGSETPSRSTSARSSSWSAIEPPAADEPNSERPNRAPSSSAQSTSRTVTGGVPSSAIRRRTSAAPRTLRQPSSQPPFGTESMWPPSRTARSESPRSVYQSLPAASRSTSSGRSERLSASHARPFAQVSVHATRCAPSSFPVSERSSSRRETTRDGSSGTGSELNALRRPRVW